MDNMATKKQDFNEKMDAVRLAILQAMLDEVVFDGWSAKAFDHAVKSANIDEAHANLAFPKGAIDVASFMHKRGDAEMAEALQTALPMIEGFSAKIEYAINLRLKIAAQNSEAVRASAAIMALPQNAMLSASLLWHTADAIWNAVGDDAKGFSHYSKRTTLSAVYSSAFLYWLSDASFEKSDTAEFVARRIQDVGKFGKFTSRFKRKTA